MDSWDGLPSSFPLTAPGCHPSILFYSTFEQSNVGKSETYKKARLLSESSVNSSVSIAMGSQDLMLVGSWGSPFVRRIIWALKLKGLEYEFVEEDVDNKSELLLQLNPVYKKIPVLVHGGKAIAESPIILEYIDETWKQNPIMPKDPYDRAMARFWAKYADEFTEIVRKALFSSGEQQEKAVKQAMETLAILDRELRNKKFFKGENVGYLDIILGTTAIWMDVVEELIPYKIYDTEKFTFFGEWKNYFIEQPSIKENLPPMKELTAHIRHMRQSRMASA